MTTVPAVAAVGLAKDYGHGRGLFGLNLQVLPGEVFGFLGPNGAGKTTTIRLLMGMIRATAGTATVFGLDCWRDAVEVKRHVGYVPGELPQYGGLRGGEIIASLAALRGGVDRRRVSDVAERFALDLGRRFREYSRGNKQKLALLLAFMQHPDLLILDEPTSGLDPLNQQTFYELVREARDGGATVFLSSHVLAEVERVCSRVGVVRDGRLVRVAGLDELHHIRLRQVEVVFADEPPVGALAALPGIEHVQVDGRRIACAVRGSMEPLLAALAAHRIVDLVSHEPSLEEAFLALYHGETGANPDGARGAATAVITS